MRLLLKNVISRDIFLYIFLLFNGFFYYSMDEQRRKFRFYGRWIRINENIPAYSIFRKRCVTKTTLSLENKRVAPNVRVAITSVSEKNLFIRNRHLLCTILHFLLRCSLVDWKLEPHLIIASICMYIFVLINITFYNNFIFFWTRENVS